MVAAEYIYSIIKKKNNKTTGGMKKREKSQNTEADGLNILYNFNFSWSHR